MILQDLQPGQAVTLEMMWGEHSHSIKTSVIGSNESGLLIKPFIYNGIVINLPANKIKDIIFNIYAIDTKTNTRMTWKNASVLPVVYRGRTYYACKVSGFQRNAQSSERREKERMILDLNGILEVRSSSDKIPIKIHDISDNGISFYMDKNLELDINSFRIQFRDVVRGNTFSLKLLCRSVRDILNGDEKLYGCRITEADKDLLLYVCLKRMDQHANEIG